MVLSSTYQSTSLPLLSTLYEPPPKHLISVLGGDLDLWAGRATEKPDWMTDSSLSVACYTREKEAYALVAPRQQRWHITPCGRTFQSQPRYQGPARWAVEAYVPHLITSPSSLGRRKARYLAARFLTPP